MVAVTAKTQSKDLARSCVEDFYSRLQQGVRDSDFRHKTKPDIEIYVGGENIRMPCDLLSIIPAMDPSENTSYLNLENYILRLIDMAEEDSNCDMFFSILNSKNVNKNLDYFLVSKTIIYKGIHYRFVDWVSVEHKVNDNKENSYKITEINETASICIIGDDKKPLNSANVYSWESESFNRKLSDTSGVWVIGMEKQLRKLMITDPNYSDTVFYTIKRGGKNTIQLKNKKPIPELYEKTKFRLFIPFAYPMGNLGKGSDNWTDGGNAWSNYPCDLAYFFDNNKALSKAARNTGFGLGAKTIIPLKKNTTAIMVQAEYLLMPANNGKLSSSQAVPADVFYYQYNPSSGLNNGKVLETNMNFTFPRLNTVDVMLGVNKKFRNIIGSSHLELEGAAGAAWYWSSDFTGKSTIPGEFSFVANYDIFSKMPSLAFEVGLTLTLGEHLSLGLNYVNLGGFDIKGHASWSSTVIPVNEANVNNVDFDFCHVTVHYLGLVLSYSVQHK